MSAPTAEKIETLKNAFGQKDSAKIWSFLEQVTRIPAEVLIERSKVLLAVCLTMPPELELLLP